MTRLEPVAPLSLWGLSAEIAFLNNGSFGAPPLEISRKRARLLEELERNPLESLTVDYVEKLASLKQPMAAFVEADPDGFVFVPNATFGANAVLGSLRWRAGDEIVVFPHRYPAVGNAATWFAERTGAKVVTTEAPKRLESKLQLIEAYEQAIGPRTALVIVDHVTSLSAILFPVTEIIELCHMKRVPVLVDGAHAAGQTPIAIERWKPDFYTGNFHKWLFAPRPAAFLYVAPKYRETIHTPLLSNLYGKGFQEEFSWYGTLDPTPFYCAPDGLDFYRKLGGSDLAHRNHQLASKGGRLLLEALGSPGYYSPESEFFASMFAAPLPKSPAIDAPALRIRFLEKAGVEVHFAALGDQMWIRLSAQAFNGASDMERLAQAVRKLL